MANFKADIDAWVRKSERLTMAVVQTAAQTTVNEMLLPRAKGGRMRVDTGYLVNSASANIGSMSSRASSPGNEAQIKLTIVNMKPGETLYVGFTANYARIREQHDAFVRLAAQNWGRNVTDAANELKRRVTL